MASVIAFRARHCIIDLSYFGNYIPANTTIPGICSTVFNLVEKNIIPIIKLRDAGGYAYYTVNESHVNSFHAVSGGVSISFTDDSTPSSGAGPK